MRHLKSIYVQVVKAVSSPVCNLFIFKKMTDFKKKNILSQTSYSDNNLVVLMYKYLSSLVENSFQSVKFSSKVLITKVSWHWNGKAVPEIHLRKIQKQKEMMILIHCPKNVRNSIC